MASLSGHSLFPEIKTALDARIREETEAAIKTALDDVEARIRKRLAVMVMELFSQYDVMRRGNDLVITVHLNKGEQQ